MHIFYFFGDSITLGVNVQPKDSFYQLIIGNLQKNFSLPPTKFYNLGVCKNSSKEILARFDNEFSVRNLAGSTPVFFLMCGVVDTMKFTENPYLSLEESKENYTKLIQSAKSKGRVIAVSPSPVANAEQNERLNRLISIQEKICSENSVYYINMFQELLDNDFVGDLKDGVHPSEQGNKLIAGIIAKELKNCL
ncbi:MAG: SGNH/GDSL hydrolase family protein [Mailhella sp.]|nr:SGNH/GDSL hydrolase family protein [Mailhella sp.]